jgi:hypothetical protein
MDKSNSDIRHKKYSVSPKDIEDFCGSQMLLQNAMCSQVDCKCCESQCPLWMFKMHMIQNIEEIP